MVVSEMAGERSFARAVGVIVVLELWDTKLVEIQGDGEDDARSETAPWGCLHQWTHLIIPIRFSKRL